MKKPLPLIIICIVYIFFNIKLLAMEQKPYHHIYKNGKLFAFKNQKGVLSEIQISSGIGKFLEKKKRNLR